VTPAADLVLIGLATTLEPIPVTGFILVLSSEKGTRKGAAYIVGWVVSLAVVVALTVLATGGKPPKPATEPSTGILAAKILLGVILLGIAYRRRGRPSAPATQPKWMKRLDHMSGWAAASLGLLLQPWVLVGAGAATIVQLHVSSVGSVLLLVLFCLLCTASILVMEVYAIRSPEASTQRLDGLRTWIDAHRDQVIIILALVVGLWLIGDSAYLLASQ
jgi:hypothetical protein